MKKMLKRWISMLVERLAGVNRRTRLGRYLHEQYLDAMMCHVTSITYKQQAFVFSTPNALADWRAQTFSTKEPETLAWIDHMPQGSILWDIGANIGLYSIYAAKTRDCKVLAFEPSIFNLELLGRNIYLNDLVDKICIVPLAVSETIGENIFNMTSMAWGGALSTFAENVGWDGGELKATFGYRMLGISMSDITRCFSLPKPGYIKIDVDGIEHFILKGGLDILQSVREILIEINDDFHAQAEQCKVLLSSAGLVLKEKSRSELAGESLGVQGSYNQIWVRSSV
jgi:FkbM family methyltransferase